ncbi:hypothetical protein QN399_26510, partial [Pseudomonas sp. 10C3]|uniref:hypothetical protein n=1 Tax=Pseudomonas sp. 10C3 TaxID=3118753 RepID=UPI002E818705
VLDWLQVVRNDERDVAILRATDQVTVQATNPNTDKKLYATHGRKKKPGKGQGYGQEHDSMGITQLPLPPPELERKRMEAESI